MTELQSVPHVQRAEYERRFAAAAATAPEYARQECGWLEPGQFVSPQIATFWTGILAGQDTVQAAAAAGRDFYGELTGYIVREVSPENLRAYADEISKWAYLAKVTAGLSQLAGAVGRGDAEQTRNLLKDLSEAQSAGHVAATDALVGLEVFAATLDRLAGRSLSTFILPLDMATGGLEVETLTVLAARPGMGKSSLAWQIGRNHANHGGRTLFVSLEMSQRALYARAVCGLTGLRWRDVRSSNVSADQIGRLKRAAGELRERLAGKLYVNDKPNTLSTVWNETAALRPQLVVIDHLRWLRDRGDNEIVRLGNLSARLKELAKEFGCAVLVLHQLNRGVTQRDEKRPTLADLRESGQVEENADSVWFLHRPDYYADNPYPANVSASEVILAKFRDDVSNQAVQLDFHLAEQWFTRRGERPEAA